MSSPDDDASASELIVRTMLNAAGLSPSDSEVAALADGYAAYRSRVDRLYAIPIPADELPVVTPFYPHDSPRLDDRE